jgi:hypothetical protein
VRRVIRVRAMASSSRLRDDDKHYASAFSSPPGGVARGGGAGPVPMSRSLPLSLARSAGGAGGAERATQPLPRSATDPSGISTSQQRAWDLAAVARSQMPALPVQFPFGSLVSAAIREASARPFVPLSDCRVEIVWLIVEQQMSFPGLPTADARLTAALIAGAGAAGPPPWQLAIGGSLPAPAPAPLPLPTGLTKEMLDARASLMTTFSVMHSLSLPTMPMQPNHGPGGVGLAPVALNDPRGGIDSFKQSDWPARLDQTFARSGSTNASPSQAPLTIADAAVVSPGAGGRPRLGVR